MGRLEGDAQQNPEQQARMGWIRQALIERFEVLRQISRVRESSGPDAVLRILATGRSRVLKHQLQDQIAALESAESDRVAKGMLEAERAAAMSKALVLFAALPASTSLILLALLTARLLARSERLQEQLSFQAGHDSLTGLPNRQSLCTRLEQLLAQARRQKTSFAVLGIDLDRFKEVNDRFGHQAGDAFLREVAARFSSAVRQSDTMVRVGGDEFLFLAPGIRSEADAEVVARKLIESLEAPIQLGVGTAKAGVSVGIAVYPTHGDSIEALTSHADQVLYHAKAAGRGRFCFEAEGKISLEPEMYGSTSPQHFGSMALLQ